MKRYTKYNYNWNRYEFKELLRDYEDDYSSNYFIQVIGNLEDETEKLQIKINELEKQILELRYDINK